VTKRIYRWLNSKETCFISKHLTVSPKGPESSPDCLAHHVTVDGGKRRLMIASLRYLDTLVKTDGARLFSERLLHVDWVDERARS
jgi:hypothetical protein